MMNNPESMIPKAIQGAVPLEVVQAELQAEKRKSIVPGDGSQETEDLLNSIQAAHDEPEWEALKKASEEKIKADEASVENINSLINSSLSEGGDSANNQNIPIADGEIKDLREDINLKDFEDAAE